MSGGSQPPASARPPLSARGGPREASPAPGPGSAAAAPPPPSSRSRPVLARSGRAAPEEEEEGEEGAHGAPARLAQADEAPPQMGRCLPLPGALWGPDPAVAAFSHWAGRGGPLPGRAKLQRLLQHQHCLRLARHYSQCLKALSDFVCRLVKARRCLLGGRPSASRGHLLRRLCQELGAHTSHWACLQGHMRREPWLGPALLRQPEAVQHMKRSLLLLALRALGLLESCLAALLQHWACGPPTLLSQLFQGLESYNQGLREWALQAAKPGPGALGQHGMQGAQAFSVERVLATLAAERGRLAGERLSLLLPWQPTGTSGRGPRASGASGADKGLTAQLQTLCREEEEAMVALLRELPAFTGSLEHRLLRRPKWGQPLEPPDTAQVRDPTPLPSWKSENGLDASFAEAAAVLYAEYQPLFWRAVSTSLARQLELRSPLAPLQEAAGAALGQQLTHALEEARLPPEAAEELKDVVLRLLKLDLLRQWEPGFCHALGTSLVDKCLPEATQPTAVPCSQTGQLLQSLLALSMRRLDPQPLHGEPGGGRLAPASLRLQLLSLVVATSHAFSYWAVSKAYKYLASWSLSQFLLVTQGDLQLLKSEARKLLVLMSTAFSEDRWKQSPLASHWEQELSLQVHSAATSIQLFANDALELFCVDCRRMSAEVFRQSMPSGKYWRLALQAEAPSAPSEYAQAAAQTVLAPVLRGTRWLSHNAQALVLSRVTTAFLDVWMDHILAQKIKFSLQGALQLKRDFDLVQEVLQSEDFELSTEIMQLLLSLRAFQQTENAIACLIQQPSKVALPSCSWDALRKCCPRDGVQSLDGSPGSLSSLGCLEGLPVHAGAVPESRAADLLSHVPGGGGSSETYLSLAQQEWLALRLHRGRQWRMPALPCMSKPSEP